MRVSRVGHSTRALAGTDRVDRIVVVADLTGFAEDSAGRTGLSAQVMAILAHVELVWVGVVGHQWPIVTPTCALAGQVRRLCLVH